MATRSWKGSSGDWYSTSLWTSTGGTSSYPVPGDTVFINSGTVDLLGSEETSIGTVDGVHISLGSTSAAQPAAIVATEATLGYSQTITSSGTSADALLVAIGATGDAGTILASAAGGSFTIEATQAAGTQAAAFVLLASGSIAVSNGDNLILDGAIDIDNDVSIASGSTLTNNGTVTILGGLFEVGSGATLDGSGVFSTGADARLQLYSPVASTETITFGMAGRVDLGDVSAFDGDITGFLLGNTIDLLNTVANYASYSATTDQLTIKDNSSLIATLDLAGPSSELLATATDSAGGTVITYPSSPTRASLETQTGAIALGANVVQMMTTASGAAITGAGIKIGIISDSFNATISGTINPAATAEAQGYLSSYTVLQDSTVSGVTNEGLAMAELVHAVAPGATIYFYSGEGGQDEFATGVSAMVSNGVSIIVDDLTYYDSPFFQVTGTIDTAIENAISNHVNFFSAAGNFGSDFFQSAWQPATAQLDLSFNSRTPQSVSAEQFDNGTALQTVTIPADSDATFLLQWNAAWPSLGGSVPDELGMALYTTSGSLVALSQQETSSPDYGAIPEIALVTPTPSVATQYELAIYQIGSVAPSEFKYILVDGSAEDAATGVITNATGPGGIIDDPEAGEGSGTVFGHELVPSVNAVGAAYWANAPAYWQPADWTEYFSSVGPGSLLFNQNGTAFATPQSAGQVSFVAPDGVDTSLSGFQLFSGTSAAAPDAAAVAALMLQANPTLTTSQVTAMLEASAVSMGLPAAEQGAGLIQAPGAVDFAIAAAGASGTYSWTGVSSGNLGSGANWDNLTTFTNPALQAPGILDTAQFLSGGGSLTGTDTVSVLQFGSGGVWSLGSGAALTASSAITIGSGVVAIGAGASIVGKGTFDTISGTGLASASVLVEGATASWHSAGSLLVGGTGVGNLSISGAGTVIAAGATIANTSTASGSSVNVTGTGSDWTVSGALLVGNAGAGSLNITAGGTVSATSLDAGVISSGSIEGTGQISLSGPGSDLAISGNAIIGDAGSANLSILDGATLSAANLTIGSQGSGSALVSDTGSVLHLTGTLNVGTPLGVGELTIGPSATIIASKVVLNGEIVDEGGLLDPNEIDFTPGNGFVGFGTVGGLTDLIVNTGTIEAAAGSKPTQKTLTVEGTVSGVGGLLQIDAGSTMVVTGPVRSGQTIAFGGTSAALVLGDAGGFAGTVTTFHVGDELIVSGTSVVAESFVNNVLTLFASGTTVLGTVTFAPGAVSGGYLSLDGSGGVTSVACFAAGTRIGTDRGEVRVEDLTAGDLVRTVLGDALAPVVWVGHRTVDCARHPKPEAVWPVRVRAGAFGANVPVRDVYLSPDHAVYLNEVLIPVKHLINGSSVAQVPTDTVTYYHVELPAHDVVLAENLPAESYLETGDRANFANAGAVVRQFPDFSARAWDALGCAPLIVSGPRLSAARQQIGEVTVTRSAA